MAGGKLTGCKERGEWAELYFMMMAVGLGMKVLRLFGESGRYDVGVENGSRVLRVQVKSTIYGEDELLAALYPGEQAAEVWGVLGGLGFAERDGTDDSGLL